VLVQDADLEYSPNDYPCLLAPILADEGRCRVRLRASVGGGSRTECCTSGIRFIATAFLPRSSNMVTDLNLTDMETCYKVFRERFIRGVSHRMKIASVRAEITAKVAKLGCRIYEVGISYRGPLIARGALKQAG